MIKIENIEVMGWGAAIRGMRNPLNSWAKSDSFCNFDNCVECSDRDKCDWGLGPHEHPYRSTLQNFHHIGINDLNLMKRLRNAGVDHRKYMRMITVYVDITAPLYWWKEYDTYKVGTVANSCSTMHKIAAKEFSMNDFSTDQLLGYSKKRFLDFIQDLNYYRDLYLNGGILDFAEKYGDPMKVEPKDKRIWWQMIQLLPSSYNQRRTAMLNYEVLANMYHSRKNHKLDEWREFCEWIKTLPYSEIITGEE